MTERMVARTSVHVYQAGMPNSVGQEEDRKVMDSTSGSSSSVSRQQQQENGVVSPDRQSHHTLPTSNKTLNTNNDSYTLARQKFLKESAPVSPSFQLPNKVTRNSSNLVTPERPPRKVQQQQQRSAAPASNKREEDDEMPFDVMNELSSRDQSPQSDQQQQQLQQRQRTPASPMQQKLKNFKIRPTTTDHYKRFEDPYLSPSDNTRAFESVWDSTPERETNTRFVVRPPRFSDPTTSDGVPASQLVVRPTNSHDNDPSAGFSPKNVDGNIIHSSKSKEVESQEDQMETPARRVYLLDDGGASRALSIESKRSAEILDGGGSAELLGVSSKEDDSNDSLFDFEEGRADTPGREGRTREKSRRRRAMIRNNNLHEDDTSLDSEGNPMRRSPTNLQERSQQAWKSRQKKNSSSLKDKSAPKRKAGNVSFGKSDTVHHFEPDLIENNDYNDDDDGTLESYGDRSLNSEYTKTLESEVEDMIKDILFLGNGRTNRPGRRKIKHQHDVKRKLQEQAVAEQKSFKTKVVTVENKNRDQRGLTATGSASLDSEDPSLTTLPQSRQTAGTNSGQADAFGTMWSYMEGGVTAMTSALGLTDEEAKPSTEGASRSLGDKSAKSCGLGPFAVCGGKLPLLAEDETKTTMRGAQEMFGHAQDKFQTNGMANPDQSISEKKVKFADEGNSYAENAEEDQHFSELAVHAARSLHMLKGCEFDDSIPLNTYSDMQVSVVDLTLPLGLIFLENDGGCFITKVSPDGSAARSGGVEVGDQLAAINGVSSAGMTVDDVCNAMKWATREHLEIVFVRYIGPMRPSNKKTPRRMLGEHRKLAKVSPATQPVKPIQMAEPKKKKGMRWFGRGKRKGSLTPK